MKARPKYDRGTRNWNIVVNYNGTEIFLGKQEGSFVKYKNFGSKEEAAEFIKNKDGLELAKNLKEMIL